MDCRCLLGFRQLYSSHFSGWCTRRCKLSRTKRIITPWPRPIRYKFRGFWKRCGCQKQSSSKREERWSSFWVSSCQSTKMENRWIVILQARYQTLTNRIAVRPIFICKYVKRLKSKCFQMEMKVNWRSWFDRTSMQTFELHELLFVESMWSTVSQTDAILIGG